MNEAQVLQRLANSEDADFVPIWKECSPYTMTSVERGLALFRAVKHMCSQKIPGAFIECGVWRGGSSMIAIKTMELMGDTSRRIVMFDTFDGMTEAGEHDRDFAGIPAADQMEAEKDNRESALIWAHAGFEQVKKNVESTGVDMARVRFVKGDVRQTLTKATIGKIALLRLDTDFYDSTLAELDHLYPKLCQGGILIVDDFGHWQGARRAVEEYFDPKAGKAPVTPFFHWIDYTGRMAIRPDSPNEAQGAKGKTVGSKAKPAVQAVKRAPDTVQRYDYVPPECTDVDLTAHFPNIVAGNVSDVAWPWLRTEAPHVWRIDQRSDPLLIGVLSKEEAVLLHSLALPFKGKRALEIGCHFGWSSGHLLSAGLDLDIIDPRLDIAEQRAALETSLKPLSKPGGLRLWVGRSPEMVENVRRRKADPWSFVFIDGDHEGDAPKLDAEAVIEHCAEDAMVVFHDLASPHVAAGLEAMRAAGWNTRIYNTMQIMGAAWRGNVEPLAYTPDPKVPALDTVEHLSPILAHQV